MNQLKLNETTHWFRYAPEEFVRSAIQYSRFSLHIGVPPAQQFQQLNNSLARVLWMVFLPLGVGLYLKDKLWTTN